MENMEWKKPHVRHMHKWRSNITTDCWKTACEDVKCIKLSHENPITCFCEYGCSPTSYQQPRNFAYVKCDTPANKST